MKKFFALFLFACTIVSIPAFSQINLVYSYKADFTFFAHFLHSGFKLVNWNQAAKNVTIYNLDNSVFKTINITLPSDNNNSGNWNLMNVSEGLFDTDTLHISYALEYQANSGEYNTIIYNESGQILFKRDSMVLTNSVPGISGVSDFFITESDSGTLMRLTNFTQPKRIEIYLLPGHLPLCCNCNGNLTQVPNVTSPSGFGLNAEPNPANGSTKVFYTFPQGIHSGTLKFYSSNGIFVKEFNVTDMFNYIFVSTANLPAGSYFYKIVTDKGVSQGQSVVVVH
jgi:hypothetical protein